MTRIKKVIVIVSKPGKKDRIAYTGRSIKGALQYMKEFNHRAWTWECQIAKTPGTIPSETIPEERILTIYKTDAMLEAGEPKTYYRVPDFWHQHKPLEENEVVRSMRIEIIRA